jgi:uncharacterized membrane protein YdbT with pleckstrin-like domain
VPFPRRLLIEGEQLVLDLRPHWVALVLPSIVTVLILVAWGFAFANAPDDGTGRSVVIWGSLIVGVLILLWYPVRAFVNWATSNFAVTSDRIVHREGFIAKRSMEIPLEAINDVRFSQSVLERIVGAGDLIIQSASEFGRNVFANIRNPESVQRTIYEQGERNRARMATGGTAQAPAPAPATIPAAPSPEAPSVTTELQRLADLRDKGVLTESEFQNQKKKILGE